MLTLESRARRESVVGVFACAFLCLKQQSLVAEAIVGVKYMYVDLYISAAEKKRNSVSIKQASVNHSHKWRRAGKYFSNTT